MDNVQIHSVQFTADQKLLDLIDKKMNKLNKYFDNIQNADVYLKIDSKAQQIKDKTVEVRVNIPGNQLFASTSDKLFEAAAEESIDNIRRQLKRYKDKLRGNKKHTNVNFAEEE